MEKLLIIAGPTASGKTALAIDIAERFDAEIVSADSQQVYRGMDIGTGKATAEELKKIPHHLLDVCSPDEEMTAARFVELADEAILDIRRRGKAVVVAGGTMLYLRALVQGLFEGPAGDEGLRAQLRERADTEGSEKLWEELESIDPESASKIHKTDPRRIIRALEVYRLSKIPLSEHHRRHQAQPPRYLAKTILIEPERELLYQRIDKRVEAMMEEGLLAEVDALREAGYDRRFRSQQAIGYAELHAYREEEWDLPEAVTLIQRNSRRYARRQLSWYRGNSELIRVPSPHAVDLEPLERYLVASP